MAYDAEGLIDSVIKGKVLVGKLEGTFFDLGKVKQVHHQILTHLGLKGHHFNEVSLLK